MSRFISGDKRRSAESEFCSDGSFGRQVNAAAPLRPTLEALFAGATEDEVKNEFSSSTFGMKFVGVVLKNGTALVKFSQPPNETNYGSLGPFIFAEAIERTAKQFPTVKKARNLRGRRNAD